MFALAVVAPAVAGTHAGVIGRYGLDAPAYGATIPAPAYGAAIAAPAYGSAIAAPAYGPGYGHTAITTPLAKVAHAPVVSSYSTVTKHVAAAPVVAKVSAAPVVAKAAAPIIAKVAAPVAVAAPPYGGYGAALAAPLATYGHGYEFGYGKLY